LSKLKPIAILGNDALLLSDGNGRLFMSFPSTNLKDKNCHTGCGLKLKRFHFTCAFICRHKRAAQGKLPPIFEVYPQTVFIRTGISKAASAILKRLFNILEFAVYLSDFTVTKNHHTCRTNCQVCSQTEVK